MKSKLFVLSVLSLLFFASCERSIYDEREKALFTSPIFGQDVVIDSLETIEDLVSYFDKIYCEEKTADKWPVMYFDLQKKTLVNPQHGKNILAIGIEPSPCPDMMFEYDFTRILEIVKDGYNLEVEGIRVEPDSLTKYVSKQYLNFGKNPKFSPAPNNNGIWLITKKDDKLTNLNNYIAQIIDGYVLMANKYASIQYNKSLDSLTDEEFKELKKILSFHLSFKFSDEAPKIINTML